MRFTFFLIFLLGMTSSYAQILPIDFEASVTTEDFEDFSGGVAMVLANPDPSGINTSATVAQMVRDGGDIWAGSKILLSAPLDFSVDNTLSMKVYTTAPIGTTVKFKLEGDGETERDVTTTVSGEWETLEWDFTGTTGNLNEVVFMFDFGNVGDGSENSTFYFDDVEQIYGGIQIDWPCDFEGSTINYTVTDFGGNMSSLIIDPTDANNHVIQSIKTTAAATWAGTTIGTNAGFATNLPLTLTDSKMTVRVWSPTAGTPIRLKVEDSNDPTHTCETEVNTTVAADWETLEFDFTNQAPGTESLSVGLSMGWTYNMASIFFNFGTEGVDAGEQTYYFDDVRFGNLVNSTFEPTVVGLAVYPNPTIDNWIFSIQDKIISSVEIYDIWGRLHHQEYFDLHQATVDATHFAPGIYFAKVKNNSAFGFVKIIKE